MEYKIDASVEKNLIKKISIIIVFVIIIGAFIFFFNNTTYIYKSNLNKISNNFINSFCEELDLIKQYTKTSYYNTNIKYNDQTDLKIYINKNSGNEYDIFKINDNVEIYEKEGIYYLNIPEIQNTIQLNKEPSQEIVDLINNIQTKDIKKIYKKISKSIINQLNESDFYKVKYTYLNEKGKERQAYKYVIEISENRAKKILLNALKDILDEEKFLKKTDMVLKDITNNEKITSKKLLEDMIENITNYEVNENIIYEVTTTNSGLFNLNIDTFKVLCLDSNTVISETNGTVEKGNINITSYNNITKEKCNIIITKDDINRNISINYIDSENKTYNLSYNKSKYNKYNKNTLNYKDSQIEIDSEVTILDKNANNKILSFTNNKEDLEEKNDIEGTISIKIKEKQYKYEITSKIYEEDKKEEVILNKIININNLTDEKLQLVGIYFELTAEQLRNIVGPIDFVVPTEPTDPSMPGNIAIPAEPTDPTEPTQQVEPVKPPTNLAI